MTDKKIDPKRIKMFKKGSGGAGVGIMTQRDRTPPPPKIEGMTGVATVNKNCVKTRNSVSPI